jgi:hypothetical protein
LSPAAGTFIQGFDGSNVTGSIYVVDAFGPTGSTQNANLLTTAKGDLTIAYNDAANRVPVPTGTFLNPGTGNIGGLNLVPGLYKFTSDAAITGSNVTLTGNATDVWIFQIVSSLNVGNGIHVILSGGAQAANIFWQVGSSATIGTNSIFKGTILADQSISFGTGSDINGRALAFTGSVTLGSGVIITKPGLTDTSVAPILISPINNAISVSSDPIFVWKASTGASSYTLQIATDNGFNNLIYNHSGLTLTAQEVNGLINNSLYYWRVNAVKSGVTSNWSTVWSFTTISAIPSAPTLLDPANTATKVAVNPTLSWNAATGALSYTLQVATDSGFVNLIYNQNGVTSTSQLVAGLNYNTLYYWKVNAVNTGGTSIWSTIWSFTTTIPIPGAPVLTTPLYNATNTSLNPVFSWEIVNGATGYDLQVSTTNDFLTYAIIIETSLTTNNYSSGSFNQNTTYYWRVRAKNYAGNSSWTQSKFTTKQTFSVPTLLLPENNSKQNSNNIIFSWSKIDSVIYYELIVSKYSDFRTNVFDSKTLTTNTYTILGLDKSATYYWKVREIGNSEIGDWSQTFNFSILTNIRAPLLVYPDNNSYGIGKTIAFKWGAVAEANVYELQIAADMNFTNIILNYIGLTNATQTVSDLLRDINLFWRVRGVKDNDTGNWSEVWSFRTASTSLSTPVITFPIDNSTNISINPIAKWNTVVGATGYEAIFSDKPDLSNVIYVLVLGAPSATLKNLSYNKSYYWKVLARKDLATSEWTAINKFTTGSTGLNVERLDEIADSYSLLQNYPNPFNPSTNITYTISEPSHVTIRIFDVYGREIATLVNENLAMGKYSTTWEPSSTRGGLSSGVYYYQLQAGKYNEVRKMMYIR